MLDKYILSTGPSVAYGSVTLKSLQNDNVPELDLLVRESIQNSSDASLNMQGQSYSVNFTTGQFVPAELNCFLEGLEDELNNKYRCGSADFLEIRDTDTTGLTGCTRMTDADPDDHGNFIKLIYDTGKRQTQLNAGGNWGFGKSVYYRVGIGIVIFYSRIKKQDDYESRLIVTLVEDEGKKNPDGSDATLLNKINPLSAGKAWWGKYIEPDLLPVTDEATIKQVIEVFGLNEFSGDKTGTSIIIPYIDSQKLLGDIVPADTEVQPDVLDNFRDIWTQSIPDYLRLSIQKWYAPKIHNLKLKEFENKKWLRAFVNNKPIRKDDMLPFFQLVQELYNSAFFKTYDLEYISDLFENISVKAVNVRNYFDGMTTGYLSIIKVTNEELNGTKNVFSPYMYIGQYEAEGGLNEPIVMCTRDPGMIIDYPVAGPWVKGISMPEDQNLFYFAFYMPIIDKKLKSDLSVSEYAGMEFGEYLRRCEASDHMGWDDPAKMQLVSRIQKNCTRLVNENTSDSESTKIEATASKLANKLGKKLMPRIGYGKTPTGGGHGGGAGGGGKVLNSQLEISAQRMCGNKVELDYTVSFMHSCKMANLELVIATEGGSWITASAWDDDIGTVFPVSFERISIDKLTYDTSEDGIVVGATISPDNTEYTSSLIDVIMDSVANSIYTDFSISAKVFNIKFSGTMVVRADDRKYQFAVKMN